MANRTMQQKEMKMRRAWAKPFSRPSMIVPNRGILQQYKNAAKGLAVPDYEVDQMIRDLYGRDPFKNTPSARAEVVQLLEQMKLHVPSLQFFQLIDNCYQRALCWFNPTQTCYVLTHTDKRRHMFKRSMEYPSKADAMSAYHRDKVVWVLKETTAPSNSG